MSTCVINPLMMGAIPVAFSRQIYQEHGAKSMNDNDLMGEMKKQVQDSSYWSPIPTQTLPPATTDRSSRSALRALMQQPPPSALVPDSRLESDTFPSDAIQPSWSPYPDQADFKTANCLSESKLFPQQQYDTHHSPDHQVEQQDFDMQPPTSNPYHTVEYSDPSELRQTQPVVNNIIPFKQEQSDELELLHQRQALQTEMATRPDFPVGSPRTGSSLPKEFEKLQMMAFAQKQMREHIKNRLERRRSFDKMNQISPPEREGTGGSKLKFGITADGIANGPESYLMPHSQRPQQQQQQQLLFSRGLLPTAHQLHEQDMHTNNKGSSRSSFSMETKINVEDTEALVIKQFQEKVFQLDMRTRLGFQESLFRLARSARERQDPTRTSAEQDVATVIDVDSDSCDRPTSRPQCRVQIETQTDPADRNLVNMLFFPLRLPGLQSPTDHPSWSRARAVAAASSQGNWGWSTLAASEHEIRKGNTNMLQAQFHGRDGSGAVLDETTSRTVTPHMTWTGAPHLTDYASPPLGSSPIDPSTLKIVHADVNLTYRGPVAHTARRLGGIHSSTTKPLDIRAPRRCDSHSSIASELSNSPGHGGQIFNFNNVGFHGPSSYSSQEAGSFVSEEHRIELAVGSHALDQHHANKNFALMNMNDDILGAALSIQNRAEVNQINRFQRQPSSTSLNLNAKNVTDGFSPMLYEDGSHFKADGRNLGNNSISPGMSIFDQRSATVLRNMLDTEAYTCEIFPA